MKPTLAALALALTVPFTQAANAATVSVEIDTTIFAVVSSRAIPITMGENLVIQFSYDDAVEDTQLTDGFGQFENAVSSLSVVFPDDGLSLTFNGGDSEIATIDDFGSPGSELDTFTITDLQDVSGVILPGDVIDQVEIVFVELGGGSNPTLIVDDALNPPFDFDGGFGSSISAVIVTGTTAAGAPFDDTFVMASGFATVVPEPAAAALVALALGAAGGLRRRQLAA